MGEDASKPPAWKIPKLNSATKGGFGWSSHAPAAGGPAGRTVDLCLYYGKNPGILPVSLGMPPTLDKNCLEDPVKVSKIPMAAVKGGGKGTVGAEKKTSGKIDLKKMVEYADANSFDESHGKCAAKVREAFQAGGGVVDQPYPIHAKDYGPTLTKNHFQEIELANYSEKLGDIMVFDAPPNEIHGHIQLFDGTQWVSDFKQPHRWPGSKYEKANVSHKAYRYHVE